MFKIFGVEFTLMAVLAGFQGRSRPSPRFLNNVYGAGCVPVGLGRLLGSV
jgi:hypothetical protein